MANRMYTFIGILLRLMSSEEVHVFTLHKTIAMVLFDLNLMAFQHLGMKGAWKMSLGAEECTKSLHGKAEGARSWTVILIRVLLQRLTDESLIIYSYKIHQPYV